MSESHLPLPPGPRGAWLLGSTLDFKECSPSGLASLSRLETRTNNILTHWI